MITYKLRLTAACWQSRHQVIR